MRRLTLGSIVTATLLLIGCGGGSGTSSNNTTTALSPTAIPTTIPTTNSDKIVGTGYYVDSAVEGIDYSCGSEIGVTDSNGTFQFENGQNCTFTLGDIRLREINGSLLEDNITILEDNITVAQLLQTLDADGNATNGIQILNGTDRVVRDTIDSLDGLNSDILEAIHSSMKAEHRYEYNGTVVDINRTKRHILETEATLEHEGRRTQHSLHRDSISSDDNSSVVVNSEISNSHVGTEIEHDSHILDNNSMERDRDNHEENGRYMNGVMDREQDIDSSTADSNAMEQDRENHEENSRYMNGVMDREHNNESNNNNHENSLDDTSVQNNIGQNEEDNSKEGANSSHFNEDSEHENSSNNGFFQTPISQGVSNSKDRENHEEMSSSNDNESHEEMSSSNETENHQGKSDSNENENHKEK